MKVRNTLSLAMLLALVPAHALVAKDAKTYAVVNEDVGVPVFPNDITDRPYTVIGEVKAGVRKATVFSKEASQAKIYRELWEKAEKLGADAVINARYGDSHISAFSWGKTNATGTAIKFTPAPAAAPEPAAPTDAAVNAAAATDEAPPAP
ncbi:heavy metal-binding domain-containing protein [Sphingopyxis sp. SE2]|nr:heavy metal-binding domain-containing protein [Sphingopyxis sp. SE2]